MPYATLQDALIKGSGTERSFRCPVHDDNHASASVNVNKGVWFCYACGAKGKVDGYIPPQSDTDFYNEIMDILDNENTYYAEAWLDQFDSGPVHPYWLGRFKEETCRRFRLGYDHGKEKPCYPLRDTNGGVLGVVYRNLDGIGPKYRYPTGIQIRSLMFNYSPEQQDIVVLTEGAMDAIAICETGYYGVATYGAGLSATQIHLIDRIDPNIVVLAYDADRAGNAASEEAAFLLDKAGIASVRPKWDPLEYKDVAEMSITVRQRLLDRLAL